MVQIELTFLDGTRIFYEEANGIMQRFIEYATSPREKIRKYNAGKYYYLKILHRIVKRLDEKQRSQLYSELKALHDKVGMKYDSNIVNKSILQTFGKYCRGNEIKCTAFFTTIYLAMLDLEENKAQFPQSLGKTMVLASCGAIINWGKDPNEAATMFNRKRETSSNDYCDNGNDEYGSRFEKYGGYNGYDDDTIDEVFDGHPEATWNVD